MRTALRVTARRVPERPTAATPLLGHYGDMTNSMLLMLTEGAQPKAMRGTHMHPTALDPTASTDCSLSVESPKWRLRSSCWLRLRHHDFGKCRFGGHGRVRMHCAHCGASRVAAIGSGNCGPR